MDNTLSKQLLLSILGLAILIVAIVGVSYAVLVEPNSNLNSKDIVYIDYDTDGIAYFTYESNTGTVDVKLYSCTHAIDFRDMDNYEGDAYDRICIPVNCAGSVQIANIYERKYSYE